MRRGLSPKFALYLAVSISLSGVLQAIEWKERVLHSFQGGLDGALPVGAVVVDKQGNLYGATTAGGSSSCVSINECGTVYKLAPPANPSDPWTETVLYVFKGNASSDGTTPAGGIVMDDDGNLFGTTAYGGTGTCYLLGTNEGCGTVFELSPPTAPGGTWTERVLYSFKGDKDGQLPWGDVTLDQDGNIYGATEYGGGYGSCNAPYYQHCGTVYKLRRPRKSDGDWAEQVMHSFRGGEDGAGPNGGLLLQGKGVIYGTTRWGGTNIIGCNSSGFTGCGTLYKLERPPDDSLWGLRSIHDFGKSSTDALGPNGGLITDCEGHLYGTSYGTVFEFTRQKNGTWSERFLHSTGVGHFGGWSTQMVLRQKNRAIYGLDAEGGTLGGGTIFDIAGSTLDYTVLYDFYASPNDGVYPVALTQHREIFFGATQGGGQDSVTVCGNYGCGTIFSLVQQ
jgi:hypothetical protein